MSAFFQAKPRIKCTGLIVYVNSTYLISMENTVAWADGYGTVDQMPSNMTFPAYITSEDKTLWSYGLGKYIYDEDLQYYVFEFSLIEGTDLESYYLSDLVDIIVSVGPILHSAPFFGIVAYARSFNMVGSSFYDLDSWNYTYTDPTFLMGENSITSSGRFILPIASGAYRYTIKVWINPADITDGTKLWVRIAYDLAYDRTELLSFDLTDFEEEVNSVTYKKPKTYVSPLMFTADCPDRIIRIHYAHDDTNENGLNLDTDISFEYIPGDVSAEPEEPFAAP